MGAERCAPSLAALKESNPVTSGPCITITLNGRGAVSDAFWWTAAPCLAWLSSALTPKRFCADTINFIPWPCSSAAAGLPKPPSGGRCSSCDAQAASRPESPAVKQLEHRSDLGP